MLGEMFGFLLSIFLFFLVWVWGWSSFYRREYDSDATFYTQTDDGWRLAISHFSAREKTAKLPVLCIPGLGSNRFTFAKNSKGESLPLELASQGYDVFVAELRGHGLSEGPSAFGKKSFGWCFDDYLEKDLPKIIEKVKEVSRRSQLHVIGHSMGGILAYCHIGIGDSASIASAITVGSSLDYSGTPSDLHKASKVIFLAKIFNALPIHWLKRAWSPFAGRFGVRFDRIFAVPGNYSEVDYRVLFCNGFDAVSSRVFLQLKSALKPGGLKSIDGAAYTDSVAGKKTPVLAVCGDQDLQCSPRAAETTLELLSGERRFIEISPKNGRKLSYGHHDVLTGRLAREEVFPEFVQWLDRFDPSVKISETTSPMEGPSA